MLYTLRFFSSKCSLFHNANLFGACIIHILYTGCAKILYTGCAKIKKNNSGTKGLMSETCWVHQKWNKIASDTKLVFYSSAVTMMHGPINITFHYHVSNWSLPLPLQFLAVILLILISTCRRIRLWSHYIRIWPIFYTDIHSRQRQNKEMRLTLWRGNYFFNFSTPCI